MQIKTITSLLCCLLWISISAAAQEALWSGTEIVSPEIHEDNTVTFRLQAPNAKEVKLSGNWMPSEGWMPGTEAMQKDEEGIWSFTTPVLPSELYTYWFLVDGMRCTDPNNVYLIRDVSSIFNIFIIDGGMGDLYSVNQVSRGTLSRRWYHSPVLGMDRRITIYTPPGYETSREDYPVLYLLHGMGGDEEAWVTLGRASQILDNLIARGEAAPMIVVMPNGNVVQEAAPGESSLGLYKPVMMLPNTMDGTYERSFPDIIRFVENNYRVKKDKSGRAIAGLSMGGFHALHISRYYPNTFDYIGLFSAAIMPFQGVSSHVYENLDNTLRQQMENRYQLYWIGMGKTDFLYDAGVDFRKRLDDIGMQYEYVETEGGHTWANWRHYLSMFLPQLFK